MRTTAIIFLIACSLLDAVEEIQLTSGRIFFAHVLTAHDADPVSLRIETPSTSGEVSYPQSKIRSISRTAQAEALTTVDEQRQKLSIDASAEEVWKLAEIYHNLGESVSAKALARKVIQKDMQHVAAHTLLGHVQYEGQWMSVAESKRLQGFIYYQKKWLTQVEYDRLQREERDQWERRQVERQRRSEERAAYACARTASQTRTTIILNSHRPKNYERRSWSHACTSFPWLFFPRSHTSYSQEHSIEWDVSLP